MSDVETFDLTNCDREPIHIPGSIQPHGCLLACDAALNTILRHSANAPAMLRYGGDLARRPLDDVFGRETSDFLRSAIANATDPARPALLTSLAAGTSGPLDIALHSFKSVGIIEIEPAPAHSRTPLEIARSLIARLRAVNDRDQLLALVPRLVRGAFGYDRVMVYRLGHDGAGQVISEAKRTDLESFRGQWFPASDIPRQARLLYLRNTVRVIADVDFERVPIIPRLDASGEPLDLSFAHLRAVSPIHCEYLRNMGVSASMSISIIVDGELWGLIACHHYAPRRLSMAQRVAAEILSDFVSLHLKSLQQRQSLGVALEARRTLANLLSASSQQASLPDLLRGNLSALAALVPCDGIGLFVDGEWHAEGVTPPEDAVPSLLRFVTGVTDGRIFATNCLSERLPIAETYGDRVSGLMAVPISQLPRDYLIFFRREIVQTIDWGGNPEKTYESGPMGDRLTPRKSFDIWKQTVRLQSSPWTELEREIAEALRSAMVEVALRHTEILAGERSKADTRQRMLNEELNHRVKNILAVIKSVVGHPATGRQTLEDYVGTLKGRIQALSIAHDQIVRGDGGGLLRGLIEAELLPYQGGKARITLEGPAVWLDSRALSVMALVLHEMATNATKYGALSAPDGALNVSWSMTEAGDCAILWEESGGPAVRAPSRRGFGSAMISRSIPFDLGGRSDIAYPVAGVLARFEIPERHLANVEAPGVPLASSLAGTAAKPAALAAGLTVLLVEDQMLIAMDAEAMLADNGITDVITCGSVADALRRIETTIPDVGMLDINLGDDTSGEVAKELTRRGIPFIFATGYNDRSALLPGFEAIPTVRKPYDWQEVRAALETVLA